MHSGWVEGPEQSMGRAPLSMLPLWRAGFVICFQSVLVEVLYCNQADEKKESKLFKDDNVVAVSEGQKTYIDIFPS